ncbi:odorant receptor Or1 [Diachasma alloeum]|uniref:Odorant receptor n=1 Tax=Diachasma alloeum TaxID=454923 RepID=A0A4E0RQV7_9HYME|nr:odorant receptor Or1 [Diachasma alloeum]THK33214.1 odorant receptor 111 [Diachasma alloeum]
MLKSIYLSVMEADPLFLHISVFKACGIWPPAEWTSLWKRMLYKSYSFLIVGIICSNCVLQSVDAFTSMGRINDLVETLYILAAGCNLSYKAFNVVIKRQDIIKLLALPRSNQCHVLSCEEEAFRRKYHLRVRNSTILLCTVLEFTIVNMIISSIFGNIPERTLPIKIWLPSNFTEGYRYWMIYCSQLIAFTYAGTFHVFYDTFIIGVMITLCGHLQILQYRNSKMAAPDIQFQNYNFGVSYGPTKSAIERKLIIKSMEHYELLLQFAKSFNEIIFYVIFVQYSISCFIVCLSVYRLVNMSFSDPAYVFTIFYCGTVIIQTFSYCWFGNEVILESANVSESLYNSEWYSFDLATLRDFSIMLHRVQNHIEFSCTRLFVLSIDSFKNIMKLTYSGLNLLMQSS